MKQVRIPRMLQRKSARERERDRERERERESARERERSTCCKFCVPRLS
jgi:hypothetical protein